MMNDKIYTLALQAGLIEFDSIPGSSAVTPTYDSIIKSKKFAELIVRECIQRCEDIGSDLHARGSYAGDGAFKCAVDLEKHFGVEE